jgi:hypothetical protein
LRLWRHFGIEHDSDACEAGRSLLKQVDPLATDREFVGAETGEIAARLRQARNETLRDWVGDRKEHDRHCGGGLLDHHYAGRGISQDHVRHQPDQLRRIDTCELGIAGVPAHVDAEIWLSVHPNWRSPWTKAAKRNSSSVSVAAPFMSTPTRRIRSSCCARAASGHVAAPPRSVMKSRRFT